MQNKEYIDNIVLKISMLNVETWVNNSIGFYDFNSVSENIFMKILNIINDWNLVNANSIIYNSPGFDLIDNDNKILIQVSSTLTREKINNSLNKAIYKNYSGYKFKFLSSVKSFTNIKGIKNPYNLEFDVAQDIIDIKSILRKVKHLDLTKLKELSDYLDSELSYSKHLTGNDISALSDIINRLSNVNLNIIKLDLPNSTVFKIQDKINFNNLINTKWKIKNYCVFSSAIDSIYKEFDIEANNKSIAVLENISQIYNEIANLNLYDPDEIYEKCKEKVLNIIKNSTNWKPIDKERLSLYVDIILVDSFMRCKIFKGIQAEIV
ncbi:Hypothetical protein MAGb_8030 [Mycoplasmopsis agalactiae 14628]|uniref:SMEK domain-containing protein n=1 Tax=Mycoplasmopsis agalactiae 14628 TaxID=1110504 RepID=I5D510_MYCAA|nr:ABC-three component system protein [Mycoplasmopsis agalactiae]EIN14769.1 Hypothetical protein MAGb_8030 [Mycoplasmopsis agalactiae 14628]